VRPGCLNCARHRRRSTPRKRAELKLGKLAVRHESSALKTSTGTKLRFGHDVTRESDAKRREYSAAGEPVMDLISIETQAEGVLDRWRADLALDRGQRPDVKVVVQQALSMGGYLRWRCVWEGPHSGVKSGIDVILGMEAEGSMPSPTSNSRCATSGRRPTVSTFTTSKPKRRKPWRNCCGPRPRLAWRWRRATTAIRRWRGNG
jgi:hypothetical protein